MGQVVYLTRTSQPPPFARLESLSTSNLSEALSSCHKIRQEILRMIEISALAERAIDSEDARRLLSARVSSSHKDCTIALAKVSTAIHALSQVLSSRRLGLN